MVFAKEGFAGFSSRCLTGTNRKVGVQTSMELQEAARNVVVQNLRLRALLQRIGVEATVVENWGGGGGWAGAVVPKDCNNNHTRLDKARWLESTRSKYAKIN
jgi:hypothetical protein